ncbi:MAG: substrate-binding domain-containing protein [Lachnospiraceae bacterium]|jgi:phosphate transport system substrate-binding protein|nr:substrate-binding domain-containing protein [Lachnospiraceae bacterium]
MKKRILALGLAVISMTVLVACGNESNGFDDSRRIAVFTREDGSGTRDAFVGITGVGDDMYIEAIVEDSTAGIRSNVVSNLYAIGYISVGSLNDEVKALSINGVLPSDDTIRNGSYVLQRPLLICVNDEKAADELVQDFIAFMLSAEGQEISATNWTMVDANAPAYERSAMSGTIRIGGSTSVEPLMQRMREAYIALNPGVTVEISGGGSGTGISEATSGVIDIGMSSRELRENEKEALTDIDIALDGVSLIVNPENPVSNMTLEQVRAIYVGETTQWSEL